MKTLLSLTIAFILSGCDVFDSPFYLTEHKELCSRDNGMFCVNTEPLGNEQPTSRYAYDILNEMLLNFTYFDNNSWIYNDNIYEELVGDCEDIASTMAQHMVNDGVDPKYLYFGYIYNNEGNHLFLMVDTIDKGVVYLYYFSGEVAYHMPLNDVGVYKWREGNIK